MGARSRLRRLAALTAALALALTASACSNLAASTGDEEDRFVATAHSQVQTTRLVAEAALEDPPAPAVTLTVILDEARTELTGVRDDLAARPGGHETLMTLLDDSIGLVDRTRSAVEDADRDALREARRQAAALAVAFEDESELL